MRNMLGGNKIDIDNSFDGPASKYDLEINDMGKTSNFGGHLPSAQLPATPTGTRL